MSKKKYFFTVCIFIPILTLFFAEIYCRIFLGDRHNTATSLANKSLLYRESLFGGPLFRPSQSKTVKQHEIINRNKSSFYEINSLRFRGKEFSPQKAAGTIRIFFVGGSSVFDLGADGSEDWPHLVERKLKASGLNIEVINAGIPDATTFDSLNRILAELHAYAPDYVIVSGIWNDMKYFYTTKPLFGMHRSYKFPDGSPYNLLEKPKYEMSYNPYLTYWNGMDEVLTEHSHLYAHLRFSFLNYKYKPRLEGKYLPKALAAEIHEEPSAEALRQFELNYLSLGDVIRNIGARPVFLSEVTLVNPANTVEDIRRIDKVPFLSLKGITRSFPIANELIQKAANKKKIPFWNFNAEMSGKSDLFFDHVHFSTKGSELFSQLVANALQKELRNHKGQK